MGGGKSLKRFISLVDRRVFILLENCCVTRVIFAICYVDDEIMMR